MLGEAVGMEDVGHWHRMAHVGLLLCLLVPTWDFRDKCLTTQFHILSAGDQGRLFSSALCSS